MLEHYFQSPRRVERMRCKPLGEHMDGLAKRLQCAGFTRATAQRILSLTGSFNEFALGVGIEDAARIDEGMVERSIEEELRARGEHKHAHSLMQHMMGHLLGEGVIAEVARAGADDPYAFILTGYGNHLSDVKGLVASSCANYLRYARRLLEWYHARDGAQPLSRLTGLDVLDYITELADLHPSGSWRNNLCSLTRGFLRYLRWEGIVEVDLDRVVPTLHHWRLQALPRHLPWEEVQVVIDSVDTSAPSGLRDKAVLVLIATLGLRNQEVRNLQLGDIRWRAGEIRLAETKSPRERALPLPKEVGAAIAEYVLHGRPRVATPHVFVRHRAPQGPITSTHGIGNIVRKHLLRAGVRAPSWGAHVLRHSLATRMVNQGVAIKQIADVLGHASIDTTAIYTKVDTRSLSAVALPFPGGEA